MSADKRTVSTDALETLGTIIGPGEKRDAIHLAVLPVRARGELYPGGPINCVDGEAFYDDDGIGIVDPFLSAAVNQGEMFWMILRPRLIASLRHVWTHPDLPDEPTASVAPASVAPAVDAQDKRAASEAWLRDFCAKSDCPSYETVIGRLIDLGDCLDEDDGMRFIDFEAHAEIPPEFWEHAERVTGLTFTERPTHFSCSC